MAFEDQNLDEEKLSSYIYQLYLALNRTSLDQKILNKKVFAFTTVIEINGVINSIQPDVFKYFKYLKILCIKIKHQINQ